MSQLDASAIGQLTPAIERFSAARILCVGDVMLDRFIYGDVSRISPEAPIPVLTRQRESSMLGGAGNVVRNLVSLGAQCCFISVIGDDSHGRTITRLVGEEERLEPYLITEAGRTSTEKSRFISGNQQLLRCDDEHDAAISDASANQILHIVQQEITNYQAVILSDYAKGVLTDALLRAIIDVATAHSIPVFIDPKRADFSAYKGATVICPNLKELHALRPAQPLATQQDIIAAAARECAAHQLAYLLVTRGKDGMTLIGNDTSAMHIPAQARDVYDVSGAGDTAIATLAVAHASGLNMAQSAQLANLAAGVVVGRQGTATIYRTDLKSALYYLDANTSQSKIASQDAAAHLLAGWKQDGQKIGFTNGCFDLLHVGHLQSLRDAKSHCDKLIVGINSDDSVRRLKGETRPVNAEMDRATLLGGLDCVDLVVIFREDTPVELITRFQPDVLMKGADYTKDQVVGGDIVESYGGHIVLLPIKDGYSSSDVISKARAS